MRVLTLDEVQGEAGFIDSGIGAIGCKRGESRVARSYLLPPDSGAKSSLAKYIAQAVTKPCYLCITEYGIWPSAEIPLLFELVRKAVGEDRDVNVAPCHYFDDKDTDLIAVVIALCLYFVWGCSVVECANERIWTISHDEWISVSGPTENTVLEVYDAFQKFALKELS